MHRYSDTTTNQVLSREFIYRKYFYAGGTRIAMRLYRGGTTTLYWLLSDHLGSQSITANADGSLNSEVRYSAFGETRYTSATETPTDYLYTGQRIEEEAGLYYYGARFYDPVLSHFTQADTIVPGSEDARAYDRYAYVMNNPLSYVDPTGHARSDEDSTQIGSVTVFKKTTTYKPPKWTKPKNQTGSKDRTRNNSKTTQMITNVLDSLAFALDTTSLGICTSGAIIEGGVAAGLEIALPFVGEGTVGLAGAVGFYNIVLNPYENLLSLGSAVLVAVSDIIGASMPLNIVASIVCIAVAWFFYARKDIKNFEATTAKYPSSYIQKEEFKDAADRKFSLPARVAAITIPVVLVLDALALIFLEIRGGDATAVLGGTCIVMMSIFLVWEYKFKGIEKITAGVQEGFKFGMHCFAPVFLVAGFYLMGVEGYAQQILGEKAPNIVNDLVMSLNNAIPMSKFAVAPLHMFLSALTGLDGSGFNDLPLMGGLAAAWGTAIGIKVPYLAALGQITMIWIGAGCVVPWSLIAVSAITGVSAMDLGRRNFVPVFSGLVAATILCIFLM